MTPELFRKWFNTKFIYSRRKQAICYRIKGTHANKNAHAGKPVDSDELLYFIEQLLWKP